MLQHNNNYYICLDNEEFMGYVGVIDNDIRVATHPDFQGKGVGSFMIDEVNVSKKSQNRQDFERLNTEVFIGFVDFTLKNIRDI